jgi:hypothetical protein
MLFAKQQFKNIKFQKAQLTVAPMILSRGILFFPPDRSLSFYALIACSANTAVLSCVPFH